MPNSMQQMAQKVLSRWHGFLCLPRHPQSWYRDRLREEMGERRLATTRCHRLSETADVFYILSRAQHDGYYLRKLPNFGPSHLVVYAYLLSKYTLRWQFYRAAAFLCNRTRLDSMREVVNPARDHKLQEVARRHGIEPAAFQLVCRRLRMIWPLLP
ncbi:hypothetical protein EDB81DRAFT_231625 [Dactylonectria macrodidyma]|uniref:Uncharacterized protein n=1 Tax=Dactylonectria macrodidyma TaxID=307937 RepID=A0A9P9DKX7_9HYPO|nr:hypothetical protein EDB81DRAFT_231625 [Dactylonectria macrodidyma]